MMCTSTSPSATEPGIHALVEAATALTQLVSSLPTQGSGERHCVSEDEESSPSSRSPPKQHHHGRHREKSMKKKKTAGKQAASEASSSSGSNKHEIFPLRLMRMLSDPTVSSVITWLPHGRSFVVLRPDVFAECVIPRHFPESSSASASTAKYPSFTRKLNRWGFRQVSRGPDAGAFHHRLFRRDEPQLCWRMVCQKKAPRKAAAAAATPVPEAPTTAPRMPLKKRKLSVAPNGGIPQTAAPTKPRQQQQQQHRKKRVVSLDESSTASSSAASTVSAVVSTAQEMAKVQQQLVALQNLMENSCAAMQAHVQPHRGHHGHAHIHRHCLQRHPQPQPQQHHPHGVSPMTTYSPGLHPIQTHAQTPSPPPAVLASSQPPLMPLLKENGSSESNGPVAAARIRTAAAAANAPSRQQQDAKAEEHRTMLYRAFMQAMSA